MFSLRRDIGRLENELAVRSDCRLIIIDPLSAYLRGVDSHRDTEVREVFAELSDMAARHDVAIVMVSHLNKGDGRVLYRTIGSIAFVAAARAVWLLAQDPDDEARRLLLQVKNNLAANPGGLAFRIASLDEGPGKLIWDDEVVEETADEILTRGRAQNESATRKSAAADWLEENLQYGTVAVSKLKTDAAEAGLSWRTVERAKRALNIISTKDRFDGGWQWSLREHRQAVSEDCQSPELGGLRENAQPKRASGTGFTEDRQFAEGGGLGGVREELDRETFDL